MSPLRRNAREERSSPTSENVQGTCDDAFMSHIGTLSKGTNDAKKSTLLFSKKGRHRLTLSLWSKSKRAMLFLTILLMFLVFGMDRKVSDKVAVASSLESKSSAAVNIDKPATASKETTVGRNDRPVVIAHVVSLIKCTKKSSVTGFLDAAAVLRHSLHKQSVRVGASKYDYQMYAIVHTSCADNGQMLARLGYKTLIRPSPVLNDDITPGWYKSHVENENCCGSAEFIKLYAYELTEHPISVHWDLDVAIFKPMDDLFDSMLLPKDSEEGRAARSRLQVQHPERPLPDVIDAYFTRDITSAQPWEIRQGAQGGFLVARTDANALGRYTKFIKAANYTAGRGNDRGWDGLGYGGFQGAMAYQGVVAYYYDQLAPNTAVELDVCLWNQVVADVIWRGPRQLQYKGTCREYPRPGDTFDTNTPEAGKCRDCRIVSVEEVNSAHYTACKKPWECVMPRPRVPKNKAEVERLSHLTNMTTCGLLFRKWFDLRREFEDALVRHGGPGPSERNGKYEPDYFGGYCLSPARYIPLVPPGDDFDMTSLYGPDSIVQMEK